MFHDHETVRHPGELETYNAIRQHYWWPGMRTFVKNYVQGCGPCQQFKINHSPSHPALMLIESAKNTRPFDHCSMDLITDLPPRLDLGRGRPRPFEGGDFNSMHENIDRWGSSTTPTWQLVQTIWTPRPNYFWPWTSIRRSSIPRNYEITRNYICVDYGLPPPIWWSHWTSQSRNRSIPFHLLLVSSWRMAKVSYHSRVHVQQSKTCWQETHPIRIN